MKIEEMSVSNSYIGLAVKDSSEVDINSYKLTDDIVMLLIEKRRIWTSKLKINQMNCYDSKTFSQPDSSIVSNDN